MSDEPHPHIASRPTRDVGLNALEIADIGDKSGVDLNYDKQVIIREIHYAVGTNQVFRSNLSFDPDWILLEAFEDDIKDNWSDAFTVVPQISLPPRASIIGCQNV